MNINKSICLLILLLPLTLKASISKSSINIPSTPGEYVVKLKPTIPKRGLDHHPQFKVIEYIDDNLVVVRRFNRDESSEEGVEQLIQTNLFQVVEPNLAYRILSTPNDPSFNLLWNMHNTGQPDPKGNIGVAGVDINALAAWSFWTGSNDIIVGVVDTGVNYSHPDLKGNIWTNIAEQNGITGVDDDGNGYIDDIHGYNFIGNSPDPMDDNGHGSHVAGVIGATANDQIGIPGINWNVKIMALKFLGSHGGGDLSSAIKAIKYATKMGAHITNNSWGGGTYSQLLNEAIKEANESGVLFVAAAGNDGENSDLNPKYPANYQVPNVLSVAAVDNRGRLANFSNYGVKNVHIAAPGVNIHSTVLEDDYESMSGTSMASPHVAGIAALTLAYDPTMSVTQLRQRLITFASPLASLRKNIASEKMVSAYHALAQKEAPHDPNDPLYWENRPEKISTQHQYQPGQDKIWKIKVPGANKVAVKFDRFELENFYDQVIFYDHNNQMLDIWSGEHNQKFSPVSFGDSITIRLISDNKLQYYGFDISHAFYQK